MSGQATSKRCTERHAVFTAAGQGAAPRTSHLQEIAADGDEGFDAAAEASVLPRKGGGFVEGGGGCTPRQTRAESAEPAAFDDLALPGEYIIRRRNLASHRWTMVRRH